MWNAHDLEGLLSHFADEAVFTSPVAAQLLESSDGIVRGKVELRNYWAEGLRRHPDLHFELLAVYIGVSRLVVNYRNQAGRLCNEVLTFDGPLIISGHGTYVHDGAKATGAEATRPS